MNTGLDVDRLRAFELYRERFGVGRENREVGLKRGQWVPMRCCEDDYILSIWVFRIRNQRLEVGLFLSEDHTDFVRWGGVMGALIALLSDAYYRTGSMALSFVGGRGKGSIDDGFERTIPNTICEYAKHCGISFRETGSILDDEGRALYLAITGINVELQNAIARIGGDVVQTAFVVNRNILPLYGVALLLRYARRPLDFLRGEFSPEHRRDMLHDMLLMRLVLLEDRLLAMLSSAGGFDSRGIRSAHHSLFVRKVWIPEKTTLLSLSGKERTLGARKTFSALLLARSESEFTRHVESDVAAIKQLSRQHSVVFVSRDFLFVPADVRSAYEKAAGPVGLFVALDTVAELDLETIQRLGQAASSRRPLPELPE